MFKKFLPHIIAVVLFTVISALYFAPQFEGLAVRMGDDIQAKGMATGIAEHQEKYDEHPQWAPNMFSGMPAYLIDMNYDGRYVKNISEYLYIIGTPAAYYVLLMAGFYLMLLMMGIAPRLAIPLSIAYGLSSYFVIIYEAGHITKLMALCYVAPLMGSIYYAYRKNIWLGASLAGLFASVEISCSHPQITYYFLFAIVGLIITMAYTLAKEGAVARFYKATAVLAVAAVLAVGSNIVQLYYIADYAKDSIRSASELTVADDNRDNHTSGLDKDYATAWSYGKMETFNLFIPNLMGGSSAGGFSEDGAVADALGSQRQYATMLPGYWGPQPMTSGPVYVGAVVCFLFVLGIFLVSGAVRWWLLGVTLLAFILAWGRNFMWLTDFMLDYFPMYNKFRTVSMILVLAQWTMPLLGALALKRIWNNEVGKEDVLKALKNSVFVAGGIALFFVLFGGSLFGFSGDSDMRMGLPDQIISAMAQERADMLSADALRSLIFVVLTAASIYLWSTQKIKETLFVIILSALVLADMVPVDKRYLDNDDFVSVKKAQSVQPSEADKMIMADPDPNYRVANFSVGTFEDATTSYFHKSVGGYHAAKMRRYQDLIEGYLSKMDMDIYNMLNTKYFIVPSEDGVPTPQLNPDALGNAWFVDEVTIVDNADQEYMALGDINPRTTALVDKRFASALEPLEGKYSQAHDSLSTIVLTDYKINRLTYKTSSNQARLAIFSEVFTSKGWSVTIDGKEAQQLRADYLLRGVVVPEGEHEVVFSFKAPHYNALKATTAASSLLLLLGAMGAIFVNIKRRKNGKL